MLNKHNDKDKEWAWNRSQHELRLDQACHVTHVMASLSGQPGQARHHYYHTTPRLHHFQGDTRRGKLKAAAAHTRVVAPAAVHIPDVHMAGDHGVGRCACQLNHTRLATREAAQAVPDRLHAERRPLPSVLRAEIRLHAPGEGCTVSIAACFARCSLLLGGSGLHVGSC